MNYQDEVISSLRSALQNQDTAMRRWSVRRLRSTRLLCPWKHSLLYAVQPVVVLYSWLSSLFCQVRSCLIPLLCSNTSPCSRC